LFFDLTGGEIRALRSIHLIVGLAQSQGFLYGGDLCSQVIALQTRVIYGVKEGLIHSAPSCFGFVVAMGYLY